MPRIKAVSNILLNTGLQGKSVNLIKAKPVDITVFFSEEEAQNLLTVLPDIKPVKIGTLNQKAKNKLIKTKLQLQASAREAFKLALSANQIKREQKCFAVNSHLLIQSQSKEINEQGQSVLEVLKNSYRKNSNLVQKLTKAINTIPFKKTVKSNISRWILEDSSESQQILNQPYTLLLNPTIIYGNDLQKSYQECVSFPFIDCMIPRYNRLLIHYFNEYQKSQFLYTSGFLSRIIQHQCDHLQGRTILDWRINHGNIALNPSVQKYFPKSASVIEDYSKSLKQIFKQFPELIQQRPQYIIEPEQLQKLLAKIYESQSVNEQGPKLVAKKKVKFQQGKNFNFVQNHNTNFTVNKRIITDLLPFEDDYITRIVKHFKKQFTKFDQKVQLGLITNQNIQNQNNTKTIQDTTYVQQTYSKTIKVTYLKTEKSEIKINKDKIQATKDIYSEQIYDISDEEVEKLLAKNKKGKKRK